MEVKIKKIIFIVTIYILINSLIWGSLNVYKRSYNTINSEQIAVMSVKINDKKITDVAVLDRNFKVVVAKKDTIEVISTLGYLVMPEKMKSSIRIIFNLADYMDLLSD